MNYRILCPNGHTVQASPELEGRQAVCPICEVKFTVHVPAEALSPNIPTAKIEHPTPARPSTETNSPQATPPASTQETATKVPSIITRRRSDSKSSSTQSESLPLMLGRGLLLAGLVLVLLSKGCETTGARAGARARAKLVLEQSRFEYEWEQKTQPILDRLEDLDDQIEESEDPTQLYETRSNVSEDLTELQDQRDKEERDLLNEMSKDVYKAVNTESKNAVNSYWRGWAFVMASALLSVGLCLTAWTAVGPERWICLSVLLILVYSVYVGGAAWDSTPPEFDPLDIMPKTSVY